MDTNVMNELIELCSVPGVSGREEKVREKIIYMLEKNNFGEKQKNLPALSVDKIGNLIGKVPSRNNPESSKNVIVMAHMDEIGFYITSLRDDGKLEVRNVGGIIEDAIQGSFVEVVTGNGIVDGVIGTVPPHLKSDGVVFEKVVDVGARSKQELIDVGVSVMDYVVFKKHFSILNKEFLALRSLDDRFGCYTLIESCKDISPNSNLVFSWTVQEEVGLRGAKALLNHFATFERVDFDLAIAVDSFACCSKQNKHIELGKGPVIRAYDNSSISAPDVVKFILKLAEREGIPVQLGTTGGGNDASVFVEYGVPMVALSVPIRYLHSQVEMLNIKDLLNLIKLLRLFLESF